MTLTAVPTGRVERHSDNTAVIAEWADWLRERLDHQWRHGEWDASLLLFTGDPTNPRTGVGVCPVAGCGATFSSLSASYCVLCTNAYRRSGMREEEFEATYARHNRRLNVYRRVAPCAVPVCVRDPFALGLCQTHYRSWVKARDRPGIDQTAWMATLRPLGEAEQCRVLACSRERATTDGLCRTHREKWRLWSKSTGLREDDEAAVTLWAERQPPFLAAHVFSLSPLSPVARLEMLYVLQQRDERGKNLSPQAVRGSVETLADLPSMAWAGVAFPEPATAAVNDGTRSLLSGVRWELAAGLDQFRGIDPTRKLVWDLRTVSQVIPSLKKGVSALRNPSSLDFGEVRHEWLRSILMHWARTAYPNSKNLRRWHLSVNAL